MLMRDHAVGVAPMHNGRVVIMRRIFGPTLIVSVGGAFTRQQKYSRRSVRECNVKRSLVVLCLLAGSVAHADPRTDVQRAFDGVISAGGFRGYAQGHVFGPGAPAMSGEVDVLFPDRIHVRSDALEFVALRDRGWINAFGVWTPTDRSLLPVTAFDMHAMREAIASIRDVRLEGTAKTSQCPSHVYRFRSSGQLPVAGGEGDLRVWLCDGNGKPARLEAVDAATAQKLAFDFDWAQRPDVRAPHD